MSNDATVADAPADEEFYDNNGLQYEKFFGHDAAHHEHVSRFIDLLPVSEARVLDCGCGTGKPVSHMIAARGHHVYGIDTSQGMVDLSSRQVPTGTFERADMLEYEPPNGKFHGIVVSLSLFERTREEITQVFSKLFEFLLPNGIFLLVTNGAEDCETTPRMWDSDGECARGIIFRFMGNSLPATLFSKTGWNNQLTQAGFEPFYTDTRRFVPAPEAGSSSETRYYVISRKPATA
ncbi:hypothetical protein MMC29_005858 [Sticta canariensis]|nr:hypothetical protein [Sticta canariensis]